MTETSRNDSLKKISLDGLWRNNTGLVQLLGLCPLLAVSNTVINALGLGIATTLVLAGSNTTVSAIRHIVRPELRIPVFVMIIACLVTIVEYLTKAFFHDLFLILGIFLPLITTNCVIIARAEAFASRNPVSHAFVDGVMMGLGFTAVLVVLGALREIIGKGTLFGDAHLMFGENAHWMTITFMKDYDGFLLAILPPGAFIGLGILIACKNYIDRHARQRALLAKQKPGAESKAAQPVT
ncbi:MAG: electron transport complex subunit E [Gammaproteobacteria bacterium]|nr:electron transport complex subunit E [Gammaproteobacteria bacterium]